MTKQEILSFLNANPVFQLATCEGARPRVRSLMLHKADETGIYFMVGKVKDVYRQLSLNPEVELCFHTDQHQVRITGKAEKIDNNPSLKEEILEVRPYLKYLIEGFGMKYMAVYRVSNGVASEWSLETDMQPKVYVQL